MNHSNSLFGTFWLTGALAFNGMPGTGPYRSLFLILGIGHLVWTLRRHTGQPIRPDHKPVSGLLLALPLWFVAQALVISGTPIEALKVITSHWGKILIVIAIMATFVAYSNDRPATRSWLVLGVFLSSFLHVVATLAFQAWTYAATGNLPIGESLFGNYGYISPYITASAAILGADLTTRLTRTGHLLPFPAAIAWLLLLCTLIAQGLLADKAGYLMTAIVLIIAAGITISCRKDGRPYAVAATAALLCVALATPLLFANHWDNATQSLTYAIRHTDDIRSTFTGSSNPDNPVNNYTDASFFLRYAWGKAGLQAIGTHPLGYGYGTIGYGQYIAETYGVTGTVSSHSGWIDFTIDNGIPGFLLLLLLTAAIIRQGWRAFKEGSPSGLALMLFVINYMGRCAIDGHLVGSRLTGFAFAAAALWAASTVIRNADQPD